MRYINTENKAPTCARFFVDRLLSSRLAGAYNVIQSATAAQSPAIDKYFSERLNEKKKTPQQPRITVETRLIK